MRILCFVSAFVIVSCQPSCILGGEHIGLLEGRSYPFHFEMTFGCPAREGQYSLLISDVDCDQRDEFLFLAPGSNIRNRIELWDERFEVKSWILNIPNVVKKPACMNLDHDGDLEIVFPEKVEDSIYLNVYTSERKLLNRFFACSGIDRHEDGQWDGWVIPKVALDLNGDEYLDIVSIIHSAHDLHPRGVSAFDWIEGRQIWRFETGTQLQDIMSGDIDGDDIPEIICTTSAPCNGSNANETDDYHSYIIILDVSGKPIWLKETGGMFSKNYATIVDFDSDGVQDIFVYCNFDNEQKSKITISPGNSHTQSRNRNFFSTIVSYSIRDITNDGQLDVIVLQNDGKLLVMDSNLEEIMAFDCPNNATSMLVEDMNNDGQLEIILSGLNKRTIVLDNELEKNMALFDDGGILYSVITNPGQPKRLALLASDYLYFLDLVKAPPPPYQFYLIMGLTGILALFIFMFARGKRHKPLSLLEPGLLDTIPGGIISLDGKGNIIFGSARAGKILGLREKQLRGQHVYQVLQNEEYKEIVDLIKKSQGGSWSGTEEIKIKINNKIRELMVSVSSLEDQDKYRGSMLITFNDVTDLAWSQRAFAWLKLAQEAAHKIKNPLTMMKLSLDSIEEVSFEALGEQKKEIEEYLNTNRKQIDALRRMTEVFMKIAEIKPPNFLPSHMNWIIQNVLDRYNTSLSSNVKIHLDLTENLPDIRADERQMETVFENLFTNAMAAIREKGTIEVSTSLDERIQKASGMKNTREYVQMQISDNGKGISKEDLDKLFDRFFSLSEGGTGLGLAIVKKIVDDHDGIIDVESEVGVGTVFSVSIPVW